MAEDLDATTRLAHAIASLTSNAPVVLRRDDATARAELDREHVERIAYLRRRHTEARARRDKAGMRRWINAMTIAGNKHRERRAALIPEISATPSLVEQLLDAVASTSGSGNGSRGVHRSPLNAAAVELLQSMRITAGRYAPDLVTSLRTWAEILDDTAVDIDECATLAERWLVEALDILEPYRRIEAKAACPVCTARHGWVREGGERIRRAAIQIDLPKREAHCIAPGCTGRWDRARFELLASILRQDVDERRTVRG